MLPVCSAVMDTFSTLGTQPDAWHPTARPAAIEANLPGLRWFGLEVRDYVDVIPDHSTVEFIARSKFGDRAHRLHETSRFERVNNLWLYVGAVNA